MTAAWVSSAADRRRGARASSRPRTSRCELFGREASDAVRAICSTSEESPSHPRVSGGGAGRRASSRRRRHRRRRSRRRSSRGCRARGSAGSRRRSRASSPSTSTAGSPASTTSTRPATSRRFPVKQGGIAAQQAEAAAEAIAFEAGVELTPRPFRPVLRGLLLTGEGPRYLRGELIGPVRGERRRRARSPSGGRPRRSSAATSPRFSLGLPAAETPSEPRSDVGLCRGGGARRRRRRATAVTVSSRLRSRQPSASRKETVGDVMSTDLLVVAPEDTLGEVAEQLRGAATSARRSSPSTGA